MQVNCDGGREARELFPKAKHRGITALALIALLIGVYAKASNAADTFRAPVLNAKSDHVAAGKLPIGTLSADANDADKCSDKDGNTRCVNRRWVRSDGMDIVVSTANTSGSSDLTGYMVVAAANQTVGLLETKSAVRNTDTPGRKDRDDVPANSALTGAVPEPLNYAMMLAGLGLMGFVASRRQT